MTHVYNPSIDLVTCFMYHDIYELYIYIYMLIIIIIIELFDTLLINVHI